jgi:hypothetical protein
VTACLVNPRWKRQVFAVRDRYYTPTPAYLELQAKHARLQAFFRHVPAFARLPPEAVAGVVLAELTPVPLAADEILYRHGDPPGPVYLIEDGRVRVLRHDNGHSRHVATLGAGESFGVVSALRGTPRMTAVEAATPLRLLTLSGETLDRLGAALPSFRTMLDEWIAQHDFRDLAGVPSDIEPEMLPAKAAAQPYSRLERETASDVRHLLALQRDQLPQNEKEAPTGATPMTTGR